MLTRAGRRRAFSVAPPPPPPTGSRMGYNLSILDYWAASYPTLDIGKTGGGYYPVIGTVTSYNDSGYPLMASGSTVQRGIVLNMDNEYGYFPPGDYEIVTTDPNFFVIAPSVGTGVSVAASGTGRATFTVVDAAHNWGDITMNYRIRNDAGAPNQLTNCRVNKISDAAALLGGAIFDPEYVAAHAPCRVIRIHDFQYTDNPDIAWVDKFANLPGTLGGENITTYINGRMPVSIGMKFTKAVQDYQGSEVRPWINVPVGAKHFWWCAFPDTNVFARIENNDLNVYPEPRLVPHTLSDGDRVVFGDCGSGQPVGAAPIVVDTIYYVRDATSLSFRLAATLGGAAIDLTSTDPDLVGATTGYGDVGTFGLHITRPPLNGGIRLTSLDIDPYNDMILPYLTACHAAWPDCHPMVEAGGENWNTGFPVWFWMRIAASFLCQGSIGNPGAGHAYLALLIWKAAESLWGAGNFTVVHGGHGSWFDNLGPSFDIVDPGVRHVGVTLKQQYIDALATPGWGPTDPVPACIYVTAAYVSNSAYSEANYPAHGIGYTILGDTYINNGNSAAVPNAYWDTRFNEEIAGLIPVLTADIAGAREKVPNMPFGMYEWGQQVAYTGSANAVAVGHNLMTYYDTQGGADMYQRVVDMLKTFNMYVWCHLEAVGGRFNNSGQFYAWNVVPPNLVDTPRSAYLKTQ